MKATQRRIAGLGQLRFFLALWVTIGHCNIVPNLSESVSLNSFTGIAARGIVHNLFNGPAAVIVFFVISGFCIHLPYRQNKPLPLLSYFTRRYVRICAPLAVALILARPLGLKFSLFQDSILWSLICEEVYYLIYPILRRWSNAIGWHSLIIGAFITAALLAATNPAAINYAAFGWQLNWLLGLPCWLLGCLLAEQWDSNERVITFRQITIWRLSAWSVSVFCSALRFHSPIKPGFSLNAFAILAFFWLRAEVNHYRKLQPVAPLEIAGKWSYSLYLTHVHANKLLMLTPIAGVFAPARLILILALAYWFYLVIEKPSHEWARHLSRLVTKENAPTLRSIIVASFGAFIRGKG